VYPENLTDQSSFHNVACVGVALRSFAEGPARPVRQEDAVFLSTCAMVHGAVREVRDLMQAGTFYNEDRVTFGPVRPELVDGVVAMPVFFVYAHSQAQALAIGRISMHGEGAEASVVITTGLAAFNLRELMPEATSIADLVPVVAMPQGCWAEIVPGLVTRQLGPRSDLPPPSWSELADDLRAIAQKRGWR